MAANPRFEISSGSPESAAAFGYSNPHRAHFSTGGTTGPNLERSSSSRENHDASGRVVPPGPGSSFPSPASASRDGDLLTMSHILSTEVISSVEQKYARQLELRSATVAAMAMVGEAPANLQQKPLEQQGLEELKRIRSSLYENATRARERSRSLSEAINKLDKFRTSLQIRKRPRTEGAGHERQIASGSGDRSTIAAAAAANANKATFCASPSHTEGSMVKQEEKIKGGVPNKRMRTSMQDVRLESRTGTAAFQRSSAIGDREREPVKPFGTVTDEKDRIVQGSGEAWERTKTKGKRSATKSDIIIASGATGASEIERDHKWGTHHRSNTDTRPRTSEGHSFRSGPVHGVVSIHKSAVRNESDTSVSVGDKGDRFLFPEKDRAMLKGSVKLLHKDEGALLSSSNVGKPKAARAPRTGTGIPINPSSSGAHASRPHSAEVWDRTASSAAPTRAQIPVGPSNNRKRPAPTRSSSPPVAQWVGQRSQKKSRIARRMNVASPVGPSGLGRDEAVNTIEGDAARDSIATPSGSRSNLSILPNTSLLKKVPSTVALSQMKAKLERVHSPAGLSESEDSEGGDAKSKEKWKKHGDAEARFGGVNQRIAPLFSPGKKSRVGSKEEGGDGIRRQGRSGRGMIAVRESSTIPPHVEKGDIAANAKQMRSARPGTEKPEKPADVKPGRPPTKKGGVGDRKALTRPRRPAINGSGEVSGEFDDDHEELMAAVQAAINASLRACSSVFWKEMEPFFAYLTHDARESLKIQVRARESEEEDIFPGLFATDDCVEKNSSFLDSSGAGKKMANGSEVNGGTVSMAFNNLKEEQGAGTGGWVTSKQLPLSQRLLAALIIEEDIDEESREDGRQFEFPGHAGDGSPSDSEQAGVDKEQDSESEVETRGGDGGKLNGWSKRSPYDSSYTSNGHRHWDSESELLNSPAKSKEEEKHSSDINGLNKLDGTYQNLKLDDRIALELQSIGLYPEPADFVVREDDQIAEELKKTYTDLKEQVRKNKERLSSLEKVISSSQEAEEREREQLAMRKLLENAFSKRLGSRGGLLGVSGSKSAASKAGRAAALVVAKRSLTRWKHFMESGESCFIEPSLRDVLLCVSSKDRETKTLSNNDELRASINSVGLSLMGPLELKMAASGGTRWICNASGTYKAEKASYDPITPLDRYRGKEEIWSNRSKEREVLLEDVVGSSGVPCGTKGKRSERERDGNNNTKGRPSLSVSVSVGGAVKGERKTKTKPRQKTGPLLKAVNGLLGKQNESTSSGRVKSEPSSLVLGVDPRKEDEATLDLSHLQIPSIDELSGQGQDLGSWLDFDDPSLPDASGDFVGLDVPPDDLADLAMMM